MSKKRPGGAGHTPDHDHQGVILMAPPSVAEDAKAKKTRRMRAILAEAEERYDHELLDDEERQEVLARIRRLRGSIAASAS